MITFPRSNGSAVIGEWRSDKRLDEAFPGLFKEEKEV